MKGRPPGRGSAPRKDAPARKSAGPRKDGKPGGPRKEGHATGPRKDGKPAFKPRAPVAAKSAAKTAPAKSAPPKAAPAKSNPAKGVSLDVRQFRVGADDDGIRLDRWFQRHLPDVGFNLVSRLSLIHI